MTTIHIASTDIMLSPGMTSLGMISVDRGWVPLHGTTIRQSIGPRHRKGRVFRDITHHKIALVTLCGRSIKQSQSP
jgi:hypothetical protein